MYITSLIDRHPLRVLFVLAIAIRVLLAQNISDIQTINMYEHGDIANNLYHGYGFAMHWPYESLDSARKAVLSQPPQHEGAFLPPINPYLIYGAYCLFGQTSAALWFVVLIYIIASACVPLFIYRIALQLGSKASAFASGLAAAIFLPSVMAVTTFSGSALYQLCGVCVLYALTNLLRYGKVQDALLTGFSIGLMILLRSEFLILAAVLLMIALYVRRSLVSIKMLTLMIVPIIVIVGPWTYRNYTVFDRFVPVLSHPWYEIWRGNNPHASGTTTDASGTSIWVHPTTDPHIIRAMDALPYDRVFEVRVDSIFRDEVLANWQNDPAKYLVLAVKKVGMFFTIDIHNPTSRHPIYAIFSVGITILIFRGFYRLWRGRGNSIRKSYLLLFGCFYLYYVALTAFTVMLPRYQIYVQTIMLPIAFIPRAPKNINK